MSFVLCDSLMGMERNPAVDRLEALVGEWTLEPKFSFPVPDEATGRVVFEWGPGRAWLVERWEVSVPEAPDGIAIIAPVQDGDGFLQHYFDSRGVIRVYEMTLADGVLTWTRTKPDFSPLEFSQRYTGRFSS